MDERGAVGDEGRAERGSTVPIIQSIRLSQPRNSTVHGAATQPTIHGGRSALTCFVRPDYSAYSPRLGFGIHGNEECTT